MRGARPVALTALAAILAVIPLSRSAFWGPMAFTIMGGLSVATFLTLFLTPSIYALWTRLSLGREKAGARRARAPNLNAIGAATAAATIRLGTCLKSARPKNGLSAIGMGPSIPTIAPQKRTRRVGSLLSNVNKKNHVDFQTPLR